MPDHPPPTASPAGPIPRRFRWLKRLSILAALYIAALVGVRIWWGNHAHNRLQAEVDRIKAAGEPLFIEDFKRPPVPDENNAAFFYKKAIAALNETNVDDDAQFLADNAEAIALVRRASECTEVDWGVQYTSPMFAMLLPQLSETRRLARGLVALAKIEARDGNVAEAALLVQDILHLANNIDEHAEGVISHLVAISERALAVATIEDLLPHVDSAGSAATRAQLQTLLVMLQDESIARRGVTQAWIQERASMHEIGVLAADGQLDLTGVMGGGGPSLSTRINSVIVGPMFRLDTIVMIRHCDTIRSAHEQKASWPEAAHHVDFNNTPFGEQRLALSGLRVVNMLSDLMMPASSAASASDYLGKTRQRMAATAIAIRLYEIDHGHRPATLEALVPDYLPAVPIDAMAADGAKIIYRPEGVDPYLPWAFSGPTYAWTMPTEEPDRPEPEPKLGHNVAILYSVGKNGVDEGGVFQLDDEGHPEFQCDMSDDLVFILDAIDLPDPPPEPEYPDPWELDADELMDDELLDDAGADEPEPEHAAGDQDEQEETEQQP